MPDTFGAALIEVEKNKDLPKDPFRKQSESATAHLICTPCNVAARGAGEKSGTHGPFMTYVREFLSENKLHSLPLVPYIGSRFNILFSNAAGLHFMADKLLTFLTRYELAEESSAQRFGTFSPESKIESPLPHKQSGYITTFCLC